MHPELFKIPFIDLTVKSYGLMMVVAFLIAIFVIRRLSRNIADGQQRITNAALYCLLAGLAGARLFYVLHYFENHRDNLLSVFAVWQGGLELLGGAISAIVVIILYLRYHKMPVRRYLDILVVALAVALAFGRIGCFLNGCCFGRPTDVPWSVRFPYGSFAYRSQVQPDFDRDRQKPYFELPDTFFGYVEKDGLWCLGLKPYEKLTTEQKEMVENGPYRCLPVHPTQLYSSANGVLLCLILYLFWRRSQNTARAGKSEKLFTRPGCTFGLMFILYGISRFFIEFFRDDNQFEFNRLTISQNICIILVPLGIVLMIIFHSSGPETC